MKPFARIAHSVHTVLVLAVLGAWVFEGNALVNRLSESPHPDRVRFYAVSMIFEWLLLLLVLAGVRFNGTSVRAVLGDRWLSARQLLRDIGIAAGFWIVAVFLLWILSWILRVAGHSRDLQFMLPNRGMELACWIALSVSAGICEEAVFRGYLQRQFLFFTGSVPAAIVLSGVVFGIAHAYQGFRMVVLIALFGMMFGYLAHWRGTVRPGMIAHAWQDSLNGVVVSAVRH